MVEKYSRSQETTNQTTKQKRTERNAANDETIPTNLTIGSTRTTGVFEYSVLHPSLLLENMGRSAVPSNRSLHDASSVYRHSATGIAG